MDTTRPETRTPKDVPAILDIGISLDGFVATHDQDPAEIHDWMFARKTEADEAFARDIMDRGSVIMGRNTFNVCYDGKAWDGPAWPVPMFVVTNEEREPLDWDGVPYTFISGLQEALTAAKEASDGRPVQIMGGGKLAAAYIGSGLLDEVRLHIAPVLMGSGVPLFAAETPGSVPGRVTAFDVVSSVQTPAATHLILKPRNNLA
ncbi:dihydrofolate reductase family protein [Arthrobacter sp.]|uniref:dihydrofolate reductase family protein n=1 Tax=Arthrobacter sp. TaxID=1667 RepID=UPI0028109D99|nr:dihydrofolate reductase family protein [Arthrobacter sp.]